MSHAEYASKQVPVLTRLALMLRQMPAVQSALARLKTLFGSGTNPELNVADRFVAGPAASTGDAIGSVDDLAAAAEPVAPPAIAAEPEPPFIKASPIGEPPISNDALLIDEVAVAAPPSASWLLREPAVVEPSPALAPTPAIDAVETVPAAVAQPAAESERETLIRRRWRETGIRMWRGTGQSVLCIQGRVAPLPPKPGETMPGYDRLEFRLINGEIVCEGIVVEPPER